MLFASSFICSCALIIFNWLCGFKDNESEVLLLTDEAAGLTYTFQAIKPIHLLNIGQTFSSMC